MNEEKNVTGSENNQLACRLNFGVPEIPVHYMRGGTSTGVVVRQSLLPEDENLRSELLRHLMGVPQNGSMPGNRQLTGLGKGPATSNKVFIARFESDENGQRIVSTLAQLAAEHCDIDWGVNCGNMSSALPLWALDCGMINPLASDTFDIEIHNTNTGIITLSRIFCENNGRFTVTEIPGVPGFFPAVDLFLQSPVGNKTGTLLPTGSVIDHINGCEVTCLDVAVPMVIINAASLGKTAHEPITELEGDSSFIQKLRNIWIEAGLKMKLRRHDGEMMTHVDMERSETIPKVCIVGKPRNGGNIAARYFTPQMAHASMAVSGGCCLAAACLLEGSAASKVAVGISSVTEVFTNIKVSIENPAGKLDTIMMAKNNGGNIEIQAAAYRRSAQILMRGYVPLYGASNELIKALVD
ncbi:TPA: PrpF domain-containing protein [Serratia marcescens]